MNQDTMRKERETCGSLTKRPVGFKKSVSVVRMMDAVTTRRKEKQIHGLSGRVQYHVLFMCTVTCKVVTR